jgi:hypothetical protein
MNIGTFAPSLLWKKTCLVSKAAPSNFTSWQVFQHLRKIVLVDVEFDTTDGRASRCPE